MARKIVITSGKGGVGKTTVVANLGIALADMGLKVALFDLDFGLNNLDVVVGVESKVVYDVSDVISGRCRLKQALVQSEKHKNLFVLPSCGMNLSCSITGQNIKLIIDSINQLFDYIIIDCPAGIDVGFHRAISCAEEAVIVVTPTLTSVRDADKVLSILRSYKIKKISILINKARGDLILESKMMTPLDVQKILKTKIIAVLPEEDVVFLSSGYGLPKKSQSYKAYNVFAENLHTDSNKIYNVINRYLGFWGSVKRRIRRNI